MLKLVVILLGLMSTSCSNDTLGNFSEECGSIKSRQYRDESGNLFIVAENRVDDPASLTFSYENPEPGSYKRYVSLENNAYVVRGYFVISDDILTGEELVIGGVSCTKINDENMIEEILHVACRNTSNNHIVEYSFVKDRGVIEILSKSPSGRIVSRFTADSVGFAAPC